MAYWNSRGLRGSALEEIINFTNESYRKKGLALFQKIDRKSTRLNSSHLKLSRMPSSA